MNAMPSTETVKRKPRKALVQALAYCVETLCNQALMETSGAIREALDADPKVWDELNEATIDILTAGLGYTRPIPPTQ